MRKHGHRHERWLHTRISEDLEEALKREARRRRSPVSLVVRNVLEGALDLVEDIVEDSLEVARRSHRLARNVSAASPSAPAREEDSLADVYGWQELILNRAASCARCRTNLGVGTAAYRGLRDQTSGGLAFLCAACVGRLAQDTRHTEETP